VANDATAQDSALGYAVAVDGNTAIAGGYGFHSATTANTGAAYVYVRSGSTWSQLAKLTASDGASGNEFGWSVGVSGTVAIIGSPYNKNAAGRSAGAAYLYVQSGTTWPQQGKFVGLDTATNDNFGIAVANTGDNAVIGAWGDSNTIGSSAGSAYIFSMGCAVPTCCG